MLTRPLPIILLLSIICLTGCRTVRVVEQVPVEVHDTAYVATVQRDSIYIDHFLEVTKTGDTVYVTERQTQYVYRHVTDTAYRYIERPVTVTRTETVTVKKPLRWWQKGLMWTGIAAIVALIMAVAFRLRRRTL